MGGCSKRRGGWVWAHSGLGQAASRRLDRAQHGRSELARLRRVRLGCSGHLARAAHAAHLLANRHYEIPHLVISLVSLGRWRALLSPALLSPAPVRRKGGQQELHHDEGRAGHSRLLVRGGVRIRREDHGEGLVSLAGAAVLAALSAHQGYVGLIAPTKTGNHGALDLGRAKSAHLGRVNASHCQVLLEPTVVVATLGHSRETRHKRGADEQQGIPARMWAHTGVPRTRKKAKRARAGAHVGDDRNATENAAFWCMGTRSTLLNNNLHKFKGGGY